MTRCPLCNDLQVGDGEWLSPTAWFEKISTSPCRYCHLLVTGVKEVDPDFFSQQRLEHLEYQQHPSRRPDETPGTKLSVSISDLGHVSITSRHQGWLRAAVRLELFCSARVGAHKGQANIFNLPVRGDVASVPGDPTMWTFLRSSLRTCMEEHSECMAKQDPGWFPERLLSIQRDSKATPVVRLIQTRHKRPHSAYIALSHCWGSERLVRTTTENALAHEEDIDYSELPCTFQDAITVAFELDVSYIWIDSLCIIQDWEDDWARHAEQMDKIYKNALIVVAAVSSSAASIPFLGPDAPSNRYTYRTVDLDNIPQDSVSVDVCASAIKARLLHVTLRPDWIEGPLERRAWAFQERYCASRIISFTDVEAKWRCQVAVGCECYGALKASASKQIDLSEPQVAILGKWREVLHGYADRKLTYNTDRLPALAGIASQFHSRLASAYLAGLWEVELPFNLAWYRRDLTDSTKDTPLLFPAMDNGVPSWSWASNHGQCCWLWDFNYRQFDMIHSEEKQQELQRTSHVDIRRISCVPSATNAFGTVKVGSLIELRGHMVPATMITDPYGRAKVSREGFHPQVVILDCKVTPVDQPLGSSTHGNMQRDPSSSHMDADNTRARSREPDPEQGPSTQNCGSVVCLLLYTATYQRTSQACVLILGQVEVAGATFYQRLGLGCGRLEGWSGTLYNERRQWALWRGWDSLEEWAEWEDWFADAELETIKVI